MNFSNLYAEFYDKIHASKAYSEEAIQISNFIYRQFPHQKTLRILDFGCGTGVHLSKLACKNFEFMGYDPSKAMVNVGIKNFPLLNLTADYESIPNGLDFIYSIFHVASYQVTTLELGHFLRQIAKKLRIGGTVLIDGWHLPGLKLYPPEPRHRSIELDGMRICRSVTPVSEDDFRTTSLHISLINEDTGQELLREIHTMRAFSKEEILEVALEVGFRNIHFRDGNHWGKELDLKSWRFMMNAEYLVN